jgi:hypothetical protein
MQSTPTRRTSRAKKIGGLDFLVIINESRRTIAILAGPDRGRMRSRKVCPHPVHESAPNAGLEECRIAPAV